MLSGLFSHKIDSFGRQSITEDGKILGKCYSSLEVERINFSEDCGSSRWVTVLSVMCVRAAEHHASVLLLTHTKKVKAMIRHCQE